MCSFACEGIAFAKLREIARWEAYLQSTCNVHTAPTSPAVSLCCIVGTSCQLQACLMHFQLCSCHQGWNAALIAVSMSCLSTAILEGTPADTLFLNQHGVHICADVFMADVCSAGGADNPAPGGDNWTGSPDTLA